MNTWLNCGLALFILTALPAQAIELREIGADEMRTNIAEGRSLKFSRVFEIVQSKVEGRLIDATAYDAGNGRIYFKVLVMGPNGSVGSIVLDGMSGRLLGKGSGLARAMREVAAPKTKARVNIGQRGGSSISNAGGNGKGNSDGGGDNGGGGGNGGHNIKN